MAGNITLRLDEGTLRRIRHLAVDQQTSVSAWVGNLVTRAVAELDGFEPARQRALDALKKPVAVAGPPLDRDRVHER